MSELLNTKQAAQYLNLKENTLEIWRVKGCGPPFCKFGRAVRYRRTDLDAFIERNLVDSTSQKPVER